MGGKIQLHARDDGTPAVVRELICDTSGRLYGHDLLEEAGIYTTVNDPVISVANSSTQVLAANATRLYALFVNDSDSEIWLRLGSAAVVNQGIRLNARGGAYEMGLAFRNLWRAAIFAIHAQSAGTKRLLVTEGS